LFACVRSIDTFASYDREQVRSYVLLPASCLACSLPAVCSLFACCVLCGVAYPPLRTVLLSCVWVTVNHNADSLSPLFAVPVDAAGRRRRRSGFLCRHCRCHGSRGRRRSHVKRPISNGDPAERGSMRRCPSESALAALLALVCCRRARGIQYSFLFVRRLLISKRVHRNCTIIGSLDTTV
jgi:hypothetical protein